MDGSSGAEQTWEQRLLSSSVSCILCSRAGIPRGATQTLETERGRVPDGSCMLSSVFAAVFAHTEESALTGSPMIFEQTLTVLCRRVLFCRLVEWNWLPPSLWSLCWTPGLIYHTTPQSHASTELWWCERPESRDKSRWQFGWVDRQSSV